MLLVNKKKAKATKTAAAHRVATQSKAIQKQTMHKFRRQCKIMHNCGLEEYQRGAPQVVAKPAEQQSKVPLPSNNPSLYTVYGENWCGWTSKARSLLQQREIPFQFYQLGKGRHEFAQRYAKGHRTIPLVFRGNQFLGGYDALLADLEA